ncbi:gal4-like Zn(II)2Cys6 binuclear cluster DNA-binding domain-containing protein [Apiospora aurea]|uniref:Gal4-like Zn(II)2Cys6 binuclear cluster DNA-binding domain-containing protein n=1 Tax=Apiospora aurea TaxID=335848 RepID=A0ABR1QAX8_9PEZI
MTTGQPPDAARHQLYPQLSTSQSLQHMGPPAMQSASANTYSVTPEGSTPGTRAYEFGHGVSEWMATDASGSSSTKSIEDLNASWRTYPQASPVSPAFSPYTTHAAPGSATWSAVPGAVVEEAGSRAEDVPWSSYAAATTRSMPYGGGGGGGESHGTYSPMTGSRTFDSRRVSTTAAYAPATSAAALSGGVAAVDSAVNQHAASLSTGAGAPPNYGAWSPHSYGGAYGRRADGYGSVWYSEGAAGAQEAPGGGESMHHDAGALYYGGR